MVIESMKKPDIKKQTSKSKKFKIKKEKILRKPQAKIQKVSATKFITSGLQKPNLAREGRTGYFNEEMMEEAKWLS